MKYKSFELDQFQIDSIKAIDNNHSVVVSAATGTGKTLIADYVINEAIRQDKKVIYTSPIKALSNQKFREFKDAYGDKVGILTGDVSINPDASILIMTTEIYRNMLLEKEPMDSLSYVVFDEIHYINDIERGTIWEESLIFSPKHVRFLCLSATIPNYKDFANWISEIKGHTVETVSYMKRAVPLKHELYDANLGICDIKKLKADKVPDYYEVTGYKRRRGKGRDRRENRMRLPVPNYIDLLKTLHRTDKVPCIFFTFSRKDAFEKGKDMGRKFDYTSSEEKKYIIEFLRDNIPESISKMDSVREFKKMLPKGFGVHHAGIIPQMKEIVEKLFAKGMIKVLFATETFAVGINMPAKTVVMNAIKKYDGLSVRYLSTKEYFQMAGRAGRRGIDDEGQVYVIVNRNDLDMDELERVTSKDVEPIISQFSVSYNTTLNLIKSHTKEEREVILRSNFGAFVKSKRQKRINQSYINYIYTLKKMEYVNEDENKELSLSWKGNFASHIYSHGLIITELYYSGLMSELTPKELILFLASIEYEGRMADKFDDKGVKLGKLYDKLATNHYVFKRVKKRDIKKLYKLVYNWIDGCEFNQLFDVCNLAEGDVIRLFRRIIDNLKQVKAALYHEKDEKMTKVVEECMDKLDRDLVKVEF